MRSAPRRRPTSRSGPARPGTPVGGVPQPTPGCRDRRDTRSCAPSSIRGLNSRWPSPQQPRPSASATGRRSTSSARWSSWSARSTSSSASAAAPPSCARRSRCSSARARELQQKIFAELSPWQKVQLSRHPARPYTLDYIERLVHRLRRAARRPPLRRRSRDRRRLRHASTACRCWCSATRRAAAPRRRCSRNFGMPQARGLPQGAAPDGAGGALRPADPLLHRHAGRVPRHRRRGARPGRGDRQEPRGDGRPAGAHRLRGHRRGRLGRRAGARRGQPDPDARVRDLLGHLARGLRVDPLARRQPQARRGGGAEDDRHRSAAARDRRRGHPRGAGRRPPRPRSDGAEPGRGAAAPPRRSCC